MSTTSEPQLEPSLPPSSSDLPQPDANNIQSNPTTQQLIPLFRPPPANPPPSKRRRTGNCVNCGATESIYYRSGPDGPATLCCACYRKYSRRQLPIYQHPVTEQQSILPFEGSVRMRIVDFNYMGVTCRIRNLQNPNLVPYGDVTEDEAARISRAALVANQRALSFGAKENVSNIHEFKSPDYATRLLMASVDAAEREVEEKKNRKGMLPPPGSLGSTQLATSFASVASASAASASGATASDAGAFGSGPPGASAGVSNASASNASASNASASNASEDGTRAKYSRWKDYIGNKRKPLEQRKPTSIQRLDDDVEEHTASSLPHVAEGEERKSPEKAVNTLRAEMETENGKGDSNREESVETLRHKEQTSVQDGQVAAAELGDVMEVEAKVKKEARVVVQVSSMPAIGDILPAITSTAPAPIVAREVPVVVAPVSASPSPLPSFVQTVVSTPSPLRNGAGASVHKNSEVDARAFEVYLNPTERNSEGGYVGITKQQLVGLASTPQVSGLCEGANSVKRGQAFRELKLFLSGNREAPEPVVLGSSGEWPRGEPEPFLMPILTKPRCLVPSCRSYKVSSNGPDGRKTLCKSCYTTYKKQHVVLYRTPTKKFSVVPHENSRPLRVIGFQKSASGLTVDFSRPIVKEMEGPLGQVVKEGQKEANSVGTTCMRAACNNVASTAGPDGVESLCCSCGQMYNEKRLVLFQERCSGQVSVQAHQGWNAVRQVEPKDQIGIILLVPLGNVPESGVLPKEYKSDFGSGSENEGGAKESDWDAKHRSEASIEGDPDMDMIIESVDTHLNDMGEEESAGLKAVAKPKMDIEGMIDITAEYKGELRSLRLRSFLSHNMLMEKMKKLFDISGECVVCYKDDEGDFVTLGSKTDTVEMFHLVRHANMKLLQIRVRNVVDPGPRRPWARMRRRKRNVAES